MAHDGILHTTDHLDRDTLCAIGEAAEGIALVLPEANLSFAQERLRGGEVEYVGIDEKTTATREPFRIKGIAAAHNEIERDEQGRCRFLGFIVTFGQFVVYHSGDTLWHDALVGQLGERQPDLVMLPINGNKPERKVAGNLNGVEAAALARAVGAGVVVPCHYHMFTFNTEEPDEFMSCCERLGQAYKIMRGGERFTVFRRKPRS